MTLRRCGLALGCNFLPADCYPSSSMFHPPPATRPLPPASFHPPSAARGSTAPCPSRMPRLTVCDCCCFAGEHYPLGAATAGRAACAPNGPPVEHRASGGWDGCVSAPVWRSVGLHLQLHALVLFRTQHSPLSAWPSREQGAMIRVAVGIVGLFAGLVVHERG